MSRLLELEPAADTRRLRAASGSPGEGELARIDDIVLRRVQAGLDVEEVRISRANPLPE